MSNSENSLTTANSQPNPDPVDDALCEIEVALNGRDPAAYVRAVENLEGAIAADPNHPIHAKMGKVRELAQQLRRLN
jgi:hypothetical protein